MTENQIHRAKKILAFLGYTQIEYESPCITALAPDLGGETESWTSIEPIYELWFDMMENFYNI